MVSKGVKTLWVEKHGEAIADTRVLRGLSGWRGQVRFPRRAATTYPPTKTAHHPASGYA
jgi:hypothetical protein